VLREIIRNFTSGIILNTNRMEHIEILINIRKILRSVNLESKRIQKNHGVSIPQYLCLNFLSKQEGYKSTGKEIKHYLNLNASTVTGIIARLETKGFIAKLPNQGDKRSTYIYLTALGMEQEKSVPPLFHEKLTAKLKVVSPKDLEGLQSALELLVGFMEVGEIDASPLVTLDSSINEPE
jgi:DNA-binding MarR family transcriptional regulator